MNYIYIQSEPKVFTVGFYDPDGKWQPESDHPTDEDAARRVECLNGTNLVDTRESTHGPFEVQAAISQALKDTMRRAKAWERLSPQTREALDMIQHKTARILAGNETYPDHWKDIAGFAELGKRRCKP